MNNRESVYGHMVSSWNSIQGLTPTWGKSHKTDHLKKCAFYEQRLTAGTIKMIHYKFLIRTYTNERHPNCLTLFDLSRSRVGKKSPLNHAKHIVDKWNFDRITLSTQTFEQRLKSQFT